MALKQGSINVVRLYKGEAAKYVYYGTSLPPGEFADLTFTDPVGQSCSIVGEWLAYGNNYYICQESSNPNTEITFLKDNLDQTIHKRVTITFNANGGSGGSSQTRTWGVEQITQPSNPTRSGYDFQGWGTTSRRTTPNVTFPRATPENNITYYAVWKQQGPQLKWQYQGSLSSPFCSCTHSNPIGTSCSVSGDTMVVCGSDIGRSGACHTVICKV